MNLIDLLQETKTLLQRYGLKGTILKFYSQIRYNWFDIRYGTETSTMVPLNQLTIDSDSKERGYSYAPSKATPLKKFFNTIKSQIPADSVFLDLGCGKGKALLVASEFSFKELRGVEFAKELCEIARNNIAAYKTKTGVSCQFQIIESDVINYVINTDENVFFMFNPFDEIILNKVLHNIESSLLIYPRKILIIYYYPINKHVIESSNIFVKSQDLSFGEHNFIVYSNRL